MDSEFAWLFDHHQIPEHTRETLVNYLLKGWKPGGFCEAILAMDLQRTVYTADMANGPAIQKIARWIIEKCPDGSWGSYEAVNNWLEDVNGCRTRFVEYAEQQDMWNVLKEQT